MAEDVNKRSAEQGPTAEECLAAIVERIVRNFDPERIILFGSRARGDADPESDFDLLVVMNFQGSAREIRLAIRRLLADLPFAKDVFVTTPEDFAWRQHVAGTLEYPAAQEGKVVYARTAEKPSGRAGVGSEGRE